MTPLSIYIHWPFCKSKCPYCDFNSHVRDGVDHARWRAGLIRELSAYGEMLPGREVTSIFFGGGTPSLMQADTVAAVIDKVTELWSTAENIEITLEANPTSVEAGKLKDFRLAGVGRASLGVQALNQQDLTFLGRHHSVREALEAVTLARDIFPRMSFDLIYARPGQSLAAWETELKEALRYTNGHISLYQLTIEENTAFHHAYKGGQFVMPPEDSAADMYQLTQEITEAYGLPAYEISNHARPGEESRHNLTYWRGEDYIGIGPGAHGRYCLNAPCSGLLTSAMEQSSGLTRPADRDNNSQRYATENIKSPERWLDKVEQSGKGLAGETILTSREQLEETAMMGLRLTGGIEYEKWHEATGVVLKDAFSNRVLKKLASESLVIADERHIRATQKGRLLLNSLTAKLLATG